MEVAESISYIDNIIPFVSPLTVAFAQSAGAVEYTNCISAEG